MNTLTYPTLDVVVGAQFGSEAKGHTVENLVRYRTATQVTPPLVIRVAGPNAGHTGHDSTGRAWALRQIPVAAVVDAPVPLGIAPGSEIDPEVLFEELDALTEAGLMEGKTLVVSSEATVISDRHKLTEAHQSLVENIGSTGKGIGAARADRLLRGADRLADRQDLVYRLLSYEGVKVVGPAEWDEYLDSGEISVVVEGTQGYGLGLHAGHYPQCTSSDTCAIDFLAMARVNPWNYESRALAVWVTARVYPIRVAGNSGALNGETTWEELGLPEERTTVTKKIRRVGSPDWELVANAVRANGPDRVHISLTMADQYDPSVTGEEDWNNLSDRVLDLIKEVEDSTGAPVLMVGTSPRTIARRF